MVKVVRSVLIVCCCVYAGLASALDVTVQGLFKGSAVLTINGKQQLLKAGKTSPEGVKLLSATSRLAVLEINGERHEMGISQSIAASFREPEKAQVRLQSGRGGHYYAAGQINGRPVDFLVDTGATHIAMNKATAQRLGINYRAGRESRASTAAGIVPTFIVNLARVTVGGISVDNVTASVHLDGSPTIVLLGNSFLGQLELKQEDGVLVMSAHH